MAGMGVMEGVTCCSGGGSFLHSVDQEAGLALAAKTRCPVAHFLQQGPYLQNGLWLCPLATKY